LLINYFRNAISMIMKKAQHIILCWIGLALLVTACQPKQEMPPRPPATVTTFVVQQQTIPAIFSFVGVAKSSHPVEIYARVEGYLWSIDYVEGSPVKKDQQLFQLDPRTYEASVAESLGVVARQEAILWRAKRSLERIQPLFAKNAVSQRDLDDATADVLTAEANVIAAKAELVQAELNLSYTKVTSPIDGLSARSVYKEGTLITPNVNGLLTEISVVDPIWVLFSVSDNELLQGQNERARKELILPTQQEYEVSLELADGSMFPEKGKVNFSSPTLDPDTGALVVRATFPNPQNMVLPGQFVKAYVSGAVRPNAIFVPQASVFQGQNGMSVFVVGKNNKVSMRNVEVGDWYGDYWIIKKGLFPEDVVIVDGVNKVTEGAIVNVASTSTVPPPKIPQQQASP
jgi:membrane fusion protein (multidrug efflux system)